jgi:predicted HNH restriction endonuclease
MTRKPRYYVVTIADQFDTVEEAGRYLDQENEHGEYEVIKGETTAIVKTYAEAAPAKAKRKPRAKRTAVEAVESTVAKTMDRVKRKYTKRTTSNGTPALANGTPVELP